MKVTRLWLLAVCVATTGGLVLVRSSAAADKKPRPRRVRPIVPTQPGVIPVEAFVDNGVVQDGVDPPIVGSISDLDYGIGRDSVEINAYVSAYPEGELAGVRRTFPETSAATTSHRPAVITHTYNGRYVTDRQFFRNITKDQGGKYLVVWAEWTRKGNRPQPIKKRSYRIQSSDP